MIFDPALNAPMEAVEDELLEEYQKREKTKRSTSKDPLKTSHFTEATGSFQMISMSTFDPDWETKTFRLGLSRYENVVSDVLKAGLYTDFDITIHNKKMRCHKMACLILSRTFRRFYATQAITLMPDYLDEQLFQKMYMWVVGQGIKFKRSDLFPLYRLARYLQIDKIIILCQAYLDSDYFNEMASFIAIHELRNCPDLFSPFLEPLVNRVTSISLLIFSSQEFLELEDRQIAVMLSADFAGVNNELELLYAALMWLAYDWPKRMISFERVISCVRFGFLSPGVLNRISQGLCDLAEEAEEKKRVESVTKGTAIANSCPGLDIEDDETFWIYAKILEQMKHYPKFLEITEEAKIFAGFLVNHDNETFQQKAKNSSFKIWRHRHWLYDPQCHYHHRLYAPNRPIYAYVTFQEFLTYLEKLSTCDPEKFKARVEIKRYTREFPV